MNEEETADAGIGDIRRALAVLGQISAEGMAIRGMQSSHPDLAAYSTVAMIAGMAALGRLLRNQAAGKGGDRRGAH